MDGAQRFGGQDMCQWNSIETIAMGIMGNAMNMQWRDLQGTGLNFGHPYSVGGEGTPMTDRPMRNTQVRWVNLRWFCHIHFSFLPMFMPVMSLVFVMFCDALLS